MPPPTATLSRRERQIMDFLYQHGPATVATVQSGITDPPSYSAVRTLLGVLETKGHAVHTDEGRAYLYRPAIPRERVRRSVLRHVVRTFFGGSAEATVAALVDLHAGTLSAEELDRLAALVDRAKRVSQ
jgi:BlaI family transcriptional regulator, penicillinase repressor